MEDARLAAPKAAEPAATPNFRAIRRQACRAEPCNAMDEQALAAQQLKDKIVVIKPPIIVKDLAAKLGLKPYQIIHHLMEMNIFTSAGQAWRKKSRASFA